MPEVSPPDVASRATLDPTEVARFSRLADEWWDPNGKFAPLHAIGSARLAFLRREACRHFGRDLRALSPLAGLEAVDVGCGGGLVAEPLARLGARVTGIDPSPESIGAAEVHAAAQGLAIRYRAGRLEDLIAGGEAFDLVVCLEVLEHVPDVKAFVALLARAVRPGGLLVLSTLNRTLKSYALAIIGAEYVLRWLPVGTHQWDRFITPDELTQHLTAAGLESPRLEGLVFDPLAGSWSLAADLSVNYMAATRSPHSRG